MFKQTYVHRNTTFPIIITIPHNFEHDADQQTMRNTNKQTMSALNLIIHHNAD